MSLRFLGRQGGLLVSILSVLLCLQFQLEAGLFGNKWEPIDTDELRMEHATINPDAPVEYLERRVEVDDNTSARGSRIDSYVRCKVFTALGVDEMSQVNFYHFNNTRVRGFAARITYPDGSSAELDRKDLYDRDVVRGEGFVVGMKSFSVPRLVPGTIIEYKWTEQREYIYSFPVFPEAAWPTQYYRLEISPYRGLGSVISTYNGAGSLRKTGSGYLLEVHNMFGIKEEPFMGARTNYEPWVYFRYTRNPKEDRNQFWGTRSEMLINQTKHDIQGRNRSIKAKAKELFAGLKDPQEKLKRAYDFCAHEIRNVYGPYSPFTYGELAEMELDDDPVDTLKHGYGTARGINNLFASLLKAGRFEVSMGLAEDKNEVRFDANLLTYNNLVDRVVIVKQGYDWQTFSPGSMYLPFGYLDSQNAGAVFLVPDKKNPEFGTSKVMPAEESVIEREATLELDESGNLSGTVTMTYQGYPAIWRKRKYDQLTDKATEESYLEAWKQQMPGAEFNALTMKNKHSFTEPLVVQFEVDFPGYGEALGSRLFFEPSFFELGSSNPFENTERLTNICYAFPHSIRDTVRFSLPEGYQEEVRTSPGWPVDIGSIKYSCTIEYPEGDHELCLKRDFVVLESELSGRMYDAVKNCYSDITVQDAYSVALRKSR